MTSSHTQPPTLLLAHSEGLVREALVGMLEAHGFEVPHQADSLQSLLQWARGHLSTPVDLMLVESELPGFEVNHLEQLAALGRIVLLARPGSTEEPLSLMRSGASGSLSLNLDGGHFAQSLRLLIQGDVVVSGDIASTFSDLTAAARDNGNGLTDREREVLNLVAAGATNREIATSLIVTQHTVKVHLRHILEKLNLRNRQQAAAWAVRSGLVAEKPDSVVQDEEQPVP
ncbi:MAG: response regulator transcription factor [Dehalococcoidia bacterium]